MKVPDQAFAHDLKYDAALDLIRSLKGCAEKNGLCFSVKLTNTLECLNDNGVLPAREKTVYLSGRPLQPLAVALARRLQDDFQGGLDITYSAGADCFNAADLLACGLKPLTVCSDLLRPGGYARFGQYLEEIRRAMGACRAASLDELVLKRAKMKDPARAVLENLKKYEATLEQGDRCRAPLLPPGPSRTSAASLRSTAPPPPAAKPAPSARTSRATCTGWGRAMPTGPRP